jgi:hypothetical protein
MNFAGRQWHGGDESRHHDRDAAVPCDPDNLPEILDHLADVYFYQGHQQPLAGTQFRHSDSLQCREGWHLGRRDHTEVDASAEEETFVSAAVAQLTGMIIKKRTAA